MSLICDVCGLPFVPFGGEDVCLSSAHRLGFEDGDVPDYLDDGLEGDDDDEAER